MVTVAQSREPAAAQPCRQGLYGLEHASWLAAPQRTLADGEPCEPPGHTEGDRWPVTVVLTIRAMARRRSSVRIPQNSKP